MKKNKNKWKQWNPIRAIWLPLIMIDDIALFLKFTWETFYHRVKQRTFGCKLFAGLPVTLSWIYQNNENNNGNNHDNHDHDHDDHDHDDDGHGDDDDDVDDGDHDHNHDHDYHYHGHHDGDARHHCKEIKQDHNLITFLTTSFTMFLRKLFNFCTILD